MYITYEGWIMDSATDRTLGKLPTMVANARHAMHKRYLAVGTHSGRVFILHFPPTTFTSPDTRAINGKIRERYAGMLHFTDDSPVGD